MLLILNLLIYDNQLIFEKKIQSYIIVMFKVLILPQWKLKHDKKAENSILTFQRNKINLNKGTKQNNLNHKYNFHI